jgi:hypothetical protein
MGRFSSVISRSRGDEDPRGGPAKAGIHASNLKTMTKDETYQKILQETQNDSGVIGFILSAGRGKGFATENSDYDVLIIVPDEKKEEYEEKYEKKYYSTEEIDIGVLSLSEFKNHAAWDGENAYHRYNFAYLKAQIDRSGEIQKLIDEKGVIPPDKVKEFVSGELGKYINSYYRAIKNYRDGNMLASRLDGTESMFALIAIVFGLEGRLRPYNKYLEWNLKTHPLKLLPWPPQTFLENIKSIFATGDIEIQKSMFKAICELCKTQGYNQAIDDWEGYYLG